MCGIAGVYLLDDSLKVNLDSMLDTLLDEIEHRGGDATGFVAFGDEGVLEWQKAAVDASDFAKYRRRVPEGTRTILAHTRWATQGLPGFNENNHPLKRGEFYAIHNGHVSNDHELFKLAGRERYGRVDSEAIPARLASLGKLEGAKRLMEEIEGAAAIAAVDASNPKDLVLAKGYASPLFVLRTKKIVLFGSTHTTVKKAYEDHVGRLPKKAKIVSLATGTMFLFKSGTFKKVNFKAYSPPKVVYSTTKWSSYSGSTAMRELANPTVPKEAPASSGWDGAEELLDCDSCHKQETWKDMSYRIDPETSETFQFCSYCVDEWDDDNDIWEQWRDKLLSEQLDPEFTVVNEEILKEEG